MVIDRLKKGLSKLFLKASGIFARVAFRLDDRGMSFVVERDSSEIVGEVELSSESLSMRADLRPPVKPKPSVVKPLAGSIEERVKKARGDWP